MHKQPRADNLCNTEGLIMPQMSNLTYSYTKADSTTGTFTWASVIPAAGSEAAHWNESIFGSPTTKAGYGKLAFRSRRNSADTADIVTINGYLPMICTNECGMEVTPHRIPFSVTTTLPDAFSDGQRSEAVSIIAGLLTNSAIQAAMAAGTNFV